MSYKRNKFSYAELFSNSDGKTSGSGFIGILIGVFGCLTFFIATIGYLYNLPNTIEVMQQSSVFIGASTLLLGARKVADGIVSSNARNDYGSLPTNNQTSLESVNNSNI